MAVLHVVNRSAALPSCLGAAATNDVVLLIEDGVYAATSNDVERPVFAIDVDVRARGIDKRLNAHTTLASYTDFVRLTEQNNPIVTWR